MGESSRTPQRGSASRSTPTATSSRSKPAATTFRGFKKTPARWNEETLTLELGSSSETEQHEPWQPTGYMEKISTALQLHGEPISPTKLVALVAGKREWKFKAISALVDGGYATSTPSGQGSLIAFAKPFHAEGSSQVPN